MSTFGDALHAAHVERFGPAGADLVRLAHHLGANRAAVALELTPDELATEVRALAQRLDPEHDDDLAATAVAVALDTFTARRAHIARQIGATP